MIWLMMKIWIALLLPSLIFAYCNNTEHCLDAIRRIVTEQRQFWFGEQWKLMCTGSARHHRRPVDCYNPHELRHFFGIGNRLFRVNTYQAGYLQNLRIFPRILFKPKSGKRHFITLVNNENWFPRFGNQFSDSNIYQLFNTFLFRHVEGKEMVYSIFFHSASFSPVVFYTANLFFFFIFFFEFFLVLSFQFWSPACANRQRW